MAVGTVTPKFTVRQSNADLQKQIAEGKGKRVKENPNEVSLFQNKKEFSIDASRITEGVKPVAEQAKVATASVNKPIFDFQNTAQKITYTMASSVFGLATASALKPSEQGSNAGDKKDEKNTFISEKKSLADVRLEKSAGNNTGNIFCGVC